MGLISSSTPTGCRFALHPLITSHFKQSKIRSKIQSTVFATRVRKSVLTVARVTDANYVFC
jgi:hypothetical protein